MRRRILASVILGLGITWTFFRVEAWLSIIPSWVSDIFAFPGMMIARFLYPAGIHTGSGTPNWWWALFLGSVLFYVILCFCILSFFHFPRVKSDEKNPLG